MRGIHGHHLFFVFVLVLLVGSSALSGQTTWTGTVSSSWSAGGNWSSGVPNAGVDAVIASGTPNSPSTAGVANAACLSLTVNPGATLTIAPGFQLNASQSAVVNGSIAGGGLLRFVGATAAELSGSGTIGASFEIVKIGTNTASLVGNVTVNGNLTQTSGNFQVSPNGGFTMSVSGNAQFQGGSLIQVNTGFLDVAGNVTFSGTIVSASPVIRCGGTWVSDSNFAPTSGLVVFDGTGAQSVTSAGTFPGITIASTSSIATSTSLILNGPLTVAGSFTDSAASLIVNGALSVTGTMSMASGPMDLNGNLTVGATGTLALGGATHTVSGNWAVTGGVTASGTVVFDGGGANVMITSTAALPSVQIAKSAGVFMSVAGNVPVNGNLTVTSGSLGVSINGGFTLSVSGNAQFQGGTLVQFNTGVIDVAGNVTFSGTSVSASPEIRCGGNWVSDAAYAPTSGLVVFDGTGAQSVTSAGTFPGVTIASTSSISTSTSLTVNGPLTVAGTFTDSAASLTVNGALSVTGTMSMATGALDLNGALTVGATGTLALGGATHTVAGNFAVSGGGLTASGTVVFDGTTASDIASTAALPSVQIAKTGTSTASVVGNLTVNGNLTQTAGNFHVSPNGSFTMSVSGNAQFQGGSLIQANTGALDIAGNVTFSGTSVGASPTILCGGNWSSNAAFAPTTGLVVFDGTGAQSVTSAGTFPGVTIASTSSISTSTSLTVNGPLTVAGSFTNSAASLTVNGALSVTGSMSMASGPMDLNGALTVGATGTLALGGAAHTVAGNFAVNGGGLTASGTVVFDGTTAADIASTAALPSVQIAKTGTSTASVVGNLTVNGNLTQTSGNFHVSFNGGFTMSVSGNAQFQGGSLIQANTGALDIAGNVTFSGTSVSASPTIFCGGNWVSDPNFAPTSGTIELDGAGATTIAHAVPGGTIAFPTLVIGNGARTMVNDFTIASSSMTIAPSGSLAISGGRRLRIHRTAGATTFNVNGALGIAANGELSMGPQTGATIAASGSLSLIGSAAQPAKITGEAGGGYALAINGSLAAKDFLVKEMGPGGLIVDSGAVIAAAPNNLRNGTFDFRTGAPAGSVLLDLRRQAPAANFDALTFLNTPGAAGVFNVKTAASGVPISFTNWTGAFAGPTFESDPNNLIAWNLQAGPTIAAFVVLPGAQLAEIIWLTTSSANVTAYQIRKATTASGPFAIFNTTPNTGSAYGVVDSPLAASQTVFYAGYAVMSGGDVLLIGTGSATPYSSATPGNVKKVGGNGAFTTIQAAINAATDPNSVVWVTPGTYDSFTIGATAIPSNLRILGDDATGPVIISTANGPIQIMNVPPSSGVELSNLTVGTATSAQNGIVISNCASPVVLDEVHVSCDGTHTAISVSGAPATAIQRCNIQGGTGLSVSNASYVAISRGSLSSLVSTGSTIEISTLIPGSVSVSPASSLITRTGLMPDINLPEFVSLSMPTALFLNAQPNAPYVIGASPRLGFQNGGSIFEMPFLLDPFAFAELPTMFTDGLGLGVVGFEVSPVASLLGFSFTVQVVVGDPMTGTPRLSNVESMVCIP